MMTMTHDIKHHLTEPILLAYSAGTLPEAFNLIVAAHISMCDTCRAQAEAYDAVGGEVLDQLAEAKPLSEDSLAATMALIAGGPLDEIKTPLHAAGVLPGPLQDYVGGDLDAIRWKPMGMGVKHAILPTSKDATARLLFIPAGAAMPDHSHHGTELTLVLKGAFHDEDDYFARGDIEIADSNTHHTPIADTHEDCICLAVSDDRLQFDGLIPKIAQRFLRI